MKLKNQSSLIRYILILFGLYLMPLSNTASAVTRKEIAHVSGNDSTILELQQVTPTPISQKPQKSKKPKSTAPAPLTETALSFSQPYLSYGFLIPGDPIIRSDHIYTKTTHKFGASLFIIQDRPLKANDASIPDTTCDDGGCSPNQVGKWNSPLTFGAGIRCQNSEHCASGFREEDAYIPLSGSFASPVVSVTNITHEAEIIYKLNIPSSQPPLPYTNNLRYVIIPNL